MNEILELYEYEILELELPKYLFLNEELNSV